MQEKSEADNNQSRSRECLVQVDKSRGKYGRAKRSQKSVPANSTETRNSFEPPRNSEELEVRNVANQKTNSGDNDQQTPSSSSFSQRRTRKTMQPVSTESVTNDHGQPQPNCRKKIIIAGDSSLKYLQSHRMSRKLQVKIATFPGCTTQYMTDRIKPLLRRNPLQIIIHVGTNSVSSSNSPRECVEEVGDLAKSVTSESSAKTTISSLICRSDDDALARNVLAVNTVLKHFRQQMSWGFIDHSNISETVTVHLNRSGLHLNKGGTYRLPQNFINYLRLD